MERIKVKFTGSNPNRGYGFYHPGDIGYIDGYAGDLAIVIKEDGSIVKAELGHISVVKECDSVCNKTVSESEDEKIRKELIKYIEDYPNLPNGRYSRSDFLSWLKKQGEQKPVDIEAALKEEYRKGWDEALHQLPKEVDSQIWQIANNSAKTWEESFAIMCASQKAYEKGKADALKEQKPVGWSEEDEKRLNNLIDWFDGVEVGLDSTIKEDYGNWLKSLRPQKLSNVVRNGKNWKPTKKQIMALRWVLNNVPYNSHKEEIYGLLEQLQNI